MVVPSSASSSVLPSSLPDSDDPHALDLLTQAATANDRVSYSGTRYVNTWSSLQSSIAAAGAVVQVSHEAGKPIAVWVYDERDAVAFDATGSRWLADAGGSVAILAAAYHIRKRGTGHVAGRMTDVVEAVRADGSVAAVLWLDRTTVLPLRRETFDVDGQMLSASAFVDVRISATATCCSGIDSIGSPGDTGLGRSATDEPGIDVRQLRADGWLCPERWHGDYVLVDARQDGDVLQFFYSDGVMSVSIFQRPGTLDHTQMDTGTAQEVNGGTVYASPGPPAQFTWASQGTVITVVADAPVDVVGEIAQAAPPDAQPGTPAGDTGFVERLSRGAEKAGTWLNPFD